MSSLAPSNSLVGKYKPKSGRRPAEHVAALAVRDRAFYGDREITPLAVRLLRNVSLRNPNTKRNSTSAHRKAARPYAPEEVEG